MSAGAQTPKIIVYRRTDAAMAGRIFDRLVQRFGKKSLFIDIDNIPFGGDFRRHIDDALKSSDLLIALVGPRWAGGEGKDAKITREADPVRVEIETALKQNITGPSRAARRGEDARAVGTSRKHPRVRLSQCGRGRVGPRLRHSCRPPDKGGRADPRLQGRTRGSGRDDA
ncbi:MAG: toll/interleukin-1 receptor domain-containing protein [Methylibium sp.]